MVHNRESQKEAKASLDEKLELSTPSSELLESSASQCAENPNPDNTFQYAFCLCKSRKPEELKYAIKIFKNLLKQGYEHQVDCMYGQSIALYLLGEYVEARTCCEAILRSEPDHSGTVELHLACIEAAEQAEEERIKNVVVSGSVAVAVATGLIAVASMAFRKK